MMSDGASSEGLRDRISARGEEALGEIVEALLENPVVNQALQTAFGARERAQSVTSHAIRNVGMATHADLERLARRVRSLSDRVEGVEDRLDELDRELGRLRGERRNPPTRGD